MPVYLLSLELENVRCFGQKQLLDLRGQSRKPSQWTLILGNNGVGKTTLLQCLNWMRPVRYVNPNSSQKNGVQAALTDEQNKVLSSLLRDGDDIVLTLAATFGKGKSLPTAFKTSIRTGIKLKGKNNTLTDQQPTENVGRVPPEPTILTYSADRRLGLTNLDDDEAVNQSMSPVSGSTELYDAAEILDKLDHAAAKKNRTAATLLQRLKEALAAILPDVPSVESINVYGPNIGSSDQKSGVRFNTPYGNVPLEGLSLGYQTVIALVLDIAWRLIKANPESLVPLNESAIVLIDEIDLHLHPLWQRKIMGDLSSYFPAVQFVATVHSPLMVDASPETNLVVLTKNDDEVLITNNPRAVQGWRVDQILTSELFGLETTRAPSVEAKLSERTKLLEKTRRTPTEKRRLEEIEAALMELPTAELLQDQEAMKIVRQAAEIVKKYGSGG